MTWEGELSSQVSSGIVSNYSKLFRYYSSDPYDAVSTYHPALHSSIVRHHRLLTSSSSGADDAKPLMYIRAVDRRPRISRDSAGSNRSLLSERQYDELERQLGHLHKDVDDDGEPTVEEGAVSTALSLMHRLRSSDYAPPLLSWHGGDAVVMLWTVGDDTIAFTITDGELGYVIRRNFKQIERRDAIEPETYLLEDLR